MFDIDSDGDVEGLVLAEPVAVEDGLILTDVVNVVD